MKKLICSALTVLLLAGFYACGKPSNDNSSAATSSDAASSSSSLNAQSNTSDATSSDAESSSSSSDTDVSNGDNIIKSDLFEGGYPLKKVGEWIYYAYNDDRLVGRVRFDGSGRLIYSEDDMKGARITKDKIYYIDTGDGNKLYKMNHDGTNKQKICDDNVILSHSSLTVYNDLIFYSTLHDPIHADSLQQDYFAINTDGSGKKEVPFVTNKHFDGWIYDFQGYTDDRICRMRYDGTEEECLTDFEVNSFIVYDECILYVLHDEKKGIYRMNHDGSEQRKLCDDNTFAQDIFLSGERIYYINYTNISETILGGQLYSMKTDGTDRKKFSDTVIKSFGFVNETLIYKTIDAQRIFTLHFISPDGIYSKISGDIFKLSFGFVLECDEGFFYKIAEHHGETNLYYYVFASGKSSLIGKIISK